MERNREITVKGIGSLSVPVDWVILSLTLEELNKDYKAGYANFENHICALQEAVASAGFKKTDLKTTEITVTTKYESVKKNGTYIEEFIGYRFRNDLKLAFNFDSKKLGIVLQAIGNSGVTPRINIDFSVNDKEAVKNRLLASAAKDAKQKAIILCEAMGVKLGKLLIIQYNWDEIEIRSFSRCEQEICVAGDALSPVDFTPDDISVEDDACFVWSIED